MFSTRFRNKKQIFIFDLLTEKFDILHESREIRLNSNILLSGFYMVSPSNIYIFYGCSRKFYRYC